MKTLNPKSHSRRVQKGLSFAFCEIRKELGDLLAIVETRLKNRALGHAGKTAVTFEIMKNGCWRATY